MKKIAIGTSAVLAIVVVAGTLLFYLRGAVPAGVGTAAITINGQIIRAEVASTEAAREKGLGGRSGIGPDEGMLFLFGGAGLHGIWMKDMQFPIDIIWMADGKIVSIEENVNPQIGATDSELKNYFPETYDDSVLELGAGRVKMFGAHKGDAVTLSPISTQ